MSQRRALGNPSGPGAHAPDGQPARWRPHITICYSTSSQPAKPIIDALGTRLPECDIDINALSLVIQHGPERAWDWSTRGLTAFGRCLDARQRRVHALDKLTLETGHAAEERVHREVG